MKAMKIPTHTTIHAEYRNTLHAFSDWSQPGILGDLTDHRSQKYFPAILTHSGQSCFELSFQISSQCGIAFPFSIAENFTFCIQADIPIR